MDHEYAGIKMDLHNSSLKFLHSELIICKIFEIQFSTTQRAERSSTNRLKSKQNY